MLLNYNMGKNWIALYLTCLLSFAVGRGRLTRRLNAQFMKLLQADILKRIFLKQTSENFVTFL